MTDGKIWQAMLKLKIFTPWMVLDELNAPSYLHQYLREKIKSLIMVQAKHGILIKYNDNPAVFGLPGQDINVIKRSCVICNSEFIPRRSDHKCCSDECIREYRRRYAEEKRKKKKEGGYT